jgi:D-alanine-D-alanine ligase
VLRTYRVSWIMTHHESNQPRPRVAVVFGGRSSEHSVSCATAASVLAAIDPTAYEVIPVGISTEGKWVLEATDADRLAITVGKELPEVDPKRAAVALTSGSRSELVVTEPGQVPSTLGEVDVVFPLLHGPWGEDGTIQGLFEMADVRYVGAGVLASAVGMDKHYMKLVLQAQGLPVLPYAVLHDRDWRLDRAACEETVRALGYPVFVKPARGGSSLGISKVADASRLVEAVEHARGFDPKVLVEPAAMGAREIECGVLGSLAGGDPEPSVVAEILVDDTYEFYDFEAKYLGEEHVELQVPASLPPHVESEVRELSVRAFEAIGSEGLARVDFFYLRNAGPAADLVINEINTMPGFTPRSMFPRLWAASGLDYAALVDRLLQLALSRSTGLR